MSGKYLNLARILSIIGGLIMLIIGILHLFGALGMNLFDVPLGWGGLGFLSAVVSAIILIVVGFLTLISTGIIKKSRTNVGFNGITILLLGIVGLLFGGGIWAILLIIAAILMLI
ncbi:hypothetical protein [Candidatus Harpocratesius sp.]